MKKFLLGLSLIVVGLTATQAQPRMIEKKSDDKPQTAALSQTSYKAKYEGGMFGYSEKESGTIKFDGTNERLVFFDKDSKELFSIPYDAIQVIYPQTTSVQSTGGRVMERVPLPGAGLAGMFMKDKSRYMIVNFEDQDVDVKGAVNFKFESKEILQSAIQTLGSKAEMQPRGDAFYRKKKAAEKTAETN